MPHIERQGTKLFYDETGRGGPPMLCVHGWGGEAAHFAAQLEHYGPSRRIVAIDRRGHGRSDAPEGPYDIPSIAEEVIWTARELGLARPVLVVHSMGAIGLEVARQAPELLSALVIIDAPALPPPEVREGFAQLARAMHGPDWQAAIEQMCDRLVFAPTDDPGARARLHGRLLETPPRVLAATMEGFLAYDPIPAARACRVPLLYVGSVMPIDEAKMRELVPQLRLGRVVGAGHFPQVMVPRQVHAMIDRFLELEVR